VDYEVAPSRSMGLFSSKSIQDAKKDSNLNNRFLFWIEAGSYRSLDVDTGAKRECRKSSSSYDKHIELLCYLSWFA